MLYQLSYASLVERETGIGPATNSLEGCDSTTELLPRRKPLYQDARLKNCGGDPDLRVRHGRSFARRIKALDSSYGRRGRRQRSRGTAPQLMQVLRRGKTKTKWHWATSLRHYCCIGYTASDTLVNEKSFTTIAGAIMPCPSPPRTRTGVPIATVFFSISTGLWLKRKFITGAVTLPCSIRKTPSRVSPVICIDCGLTTLIYQKRVTNSPRSTPAIRSARLLPPPSSTSRLGNGVGCLPALAAQ